MLRDTFFTIENWNKDNDTVVFSVKINHEHAVFSGHFPNQPVVPGVFTLQMIKECLEVVMGNKLQYTELQNCKFSNVIIPDQVSILQLECTYQQTDSHGQLKAQVKSGDTVYLTLKAMLKEVLPR